MLKTLSNKEDTLRVWDNHFSNFFKSHEGFKQLRSKMDDVATASLSNEENILDVLFTLKAMKCAIMKLKSGKCCGPDGLLAEHLKCGDVSLHLWLPTQSLT